MRPPPAPNPRVTLTGITQLVRVTLTGITRLGARYTDQLNNIVEQTEPAIPHASASSGSWRTPPPPVTPAHDGEAEPDKRERSPRRRRRRRVKLTDAGAAVDEGSALPLLSLACATSAAIGRFAPIRRRAAVKRGAPIRRCANPIDADSAWARRAVRLGRLGAEARLGIAGARIMALVHNRALNRVVADARPRLTAVVMGTRVAVIAGDTIGLGRIITEPGHWIARAGVVALVLGDALDRIASGAHSALARVRLSAGIAVVTARAVWFRRVGANSRLRIAGTGIVALVKGGALHHHNARARA